jgi:hypothetical protein
MTTTPQYQYLVSDYFATGEGRTVMILITRTHPHIDDYDAGNKLKSGVSPKTIAAREFIERFGGYYAQGAENLTKEKFIERYWHHLPVHVSNLLTDQDQPGNLNFSQSLHLNYA